MGRLGAGIVELIIDGQTDLGFASAVVLIQASVVC